MLARYSKEFFRNGFVVIPKYFSESEGKKIQHFADQLEELKEERGKWMIYFETGKKKSRIENFVKYESTIREFLYNRVVPTLNTISNDNMVLFKDKLNWKLPGGKGFKAHQDHPAWNDFPCQKFVSAALFGNNSTIENGCLQFVKGKHLEGVFDINMDNLGEIDKKIEDSMVWEHFETTPRDLLFFDSFAPHRSSDNNTSNDRRIFYFTFNSISEGDFHQGYVDKKRIEFPPDIERDGRTISRTSNKYNLGNPMQ